MRYLFRIARDHSHSIPPADEERAFLIGQELEFRPGDVDGEPTFIWRDIDGGTSEFYEFVASGANGPTRALFETCIYRAMFERKYKTSADNTSDKDFAEFMWQCVCLNACSCLEKTNIGEHIVLSRRRATRGKRKRPQSLLHHLK